MWAAACLTICQKKKKSIFTTSYKLTTLLRTMKLFMAFNMYKFLHGAC